MQFVLKIFMCNTVLCVNINSKYSSNIAVTLLLVFCLNDYHGVYTTICGLLVSEDIHFLKNSAFELTWKYFDFDFYTLNVFT